MLLAYNEWFKKELTFTVGHYGIYVGLFCLKS